MKPRDLDVLWVGEITGEEARHPEVAICFLIRACCWYLCVYNQQSEPECYMFSAHMLSTWLLEAVSLQGPSEGCWPHQGKRDALRPGICPAPEIPSPAWEDLPAKTDRYISTNNCQISGFWLGKIKTFWQKFPDRHYRISQKLTYSLHL